MIWTNLLIFTGLITSQSPAANAAPAEVRIGNARYAFADRNFAHVFDHTLVMGHTLSADFMVGVISRSVGAGTVLAERYAGRPVLANLAEPRTMSTIELGAAAPLVTAADCDRFDQTRAADIQAACDVLLNESRWARALRKFRAKLPVQIALESGLTKMFRMMEQIEDSSVPSHHLEFLNRVYAASTAIVGIDALYLDTTEGFNTCSDTNVPDLLEGFLGRAHRDGKVVILGNVPREDYANFSFLNRLTIYPQVESCRRQINDALRASCRVERNCYVVDLETIVADLARDGHLTLNDGTRISGVQTRPDGVNLSNRGTQYVVEKILVDLAAHPPRPVTASVPAPR